MPTRAARRSHFREVLCVKGAKIDETGAPVLTARLENGEFIGVVFPKEDMEDVMIFAMKAQEIPRVDHVFDASARLLKEGDCVEYAFLGSTISFGTQVGMLSTDTVKITPVNMHTQRARRNKKQSRADALRRGYEKAPSLETVYEHGSVT